ncbi:MAG: PAS domain-containing sensor histidine kinase [Gemmatimonadota bacterium]|nr:PAS domain-containing sensor histidine kinase [Gemmatimonadota bacterium]
MPRSQGDNSGPTPLAETENRRSERATHALLAFLVVLLLALGLVPVQLSKRLTPFADLVGEIYEPAQELAWQFHVAQVRAFSRVQAFQQTQSAVERRRIRDAYENERATAAARFQELQQLLEVRLPEQLGQPDEQLELRLTELWDRAEDWHLHHLPLLAGDIGLQEWLPRVGTEQSHYDGLLNASQRLNEAFGERVAAYRSQVAQSDALQQRITSGLVIAGLFAALLAIAAVGLVAGRLRRLAREADGRRGDAVLARRETDAVLRATADGVLGMDLDGRCTFINRAAAEMLGRPPRSVLGMDLDELAFGDGVDSPHLFRKALDSGNASFTTDAELQRKDGSWFPAKISCRPMIDGREVRGAVLSFVDLTEIREAESALREAVRARDEIVGVVSHDLRNPVGTIYIAADLLLEVPLPEDKRREQLVVIKRQAKHMEELIRDLLDISRIETGTLPVHPTPSPVGPMMEDALAQARSLASQKGIVIEQHVEGVLPHVNADRNRVLQVFSNLLGNAIKFTPEGGRIRIRSATGDGEVVFEVADTGVGIPPEQIDRIFDRFWQLSEGHGGAGLGLSIAKGIVEAHQGRIWVESTPGEGTRFLFTLPAIAGTVPQVPSGALFGGVPGVGGVQ